MQNTDDRMLDELYRMYRAYLFRIAYRIIGSVSDAEDLVHDVFVSMQAVEIGKIENMKAYLGRLTVNRSLNLLKSARKQREVYVGPWLPEPFVMTDPSPISAVELDETLGYAYLVMLEQLKPVERVVLVLREAFAYEYAEIADILGITDTYCRQILSRAKRKAKLPRAEQSSDAFGSMNEQVHRFLSAFTEGNIEELSTLLTEDVVIRTDGGGKVRAAIHPIYGRTRVLIFLSALQTRGWSEASPRVVVVNGEPGILFVDEHGVKAVVSLEWEGGFRQIRNIYAVMNPEKLRSVHL